MKYLFYDLEYATSNEESTKICEFGYVLTDEKFEVLERDNFVINPNIKRDEWNKRVVHNILTRSITEYESKPTFEIFYQRIRDLIENADYVIGHSLSGDAKALNDDCKRYEKESIDYDFYDIKQIYKKRIKSEKDTSLKNMVANLCISGEKNIHDAEADAYNTMLVLKKMLEQSHRTFEEEIENCEEAKDRTENFVVQSIDLARIKKAQELEEMKKFIATSNEASNSTLEELFGGLLSQFAENSDKENTNGKNPEDNKEIQ